MAPADADAFETIQFGFDADAGIGSVVLDRPDRYNAMSSSMLEELREAFDRFGAIDREGEGVSVRVVTIEGAGEDAFSSGVEVGEIGHEPYPFIAETYREAFFAVDRFEAPVLAKVDGYCLGGGLELALMCDFRHASGRSELGFPEVDLGIFPSTVGTTQRLPRIVGTSTAKKLCMTGEFLTGEDAEEVGLVDAVHGHAELDDAVDEFAAEIAGKAPLAVRAIKDTIDRSHELGIEQGTAYECQAYLPLLETGDYAEGAAAFAEDREPEWEGK